MYASWVLLAGLWAVGAVLERNAFMLLPATSWLLVFPLFWWKPWTVIDADGLATRRSGRLRRIAWNDVAGIPEPTIWTGDLRVMLLDGTDLKLFGVPRDRWAGLVALWQVGRFR
jgi:hypothetical protein